MAALAEAKTNFRDLIEPTEDAYAGRRRWARERFAGLTLPGPKTEDWRYTNLAPLLQQSWLQAHAPVGPVELPGRPTADTLRLVFVNGRFQPELSVLEGVPAGVRLGSLADAPAPVQKALASVADGSQPFVALNTALFPDGAFLHVADEITLGRPVEVVYVTDADGPVIVSPRLLVVIGKHGRASVIERFGRGGDAVGFTNTVAEVALGEGAVLEHVKVQQESSQAFHLAGMYAALAARANFTTHYLALGGRLVRNEVHVRFDGEHGEATVNGLYLGTGRQHLDHFTVIDHAKPNCASHELYKGILDDHSHGVFNGKIFVRPDAQKTDAKQTNKVLLLSEDATINTKPQLEIYADDVKCTHGATIGQLDETQLFYLQSRGIDRAASRRLLTFAFANDVVGRIKVQALRDELERRIVSRDLED